MTILLAGTVALVIGTWLGFPTLAAITVGLAIGLAWPLRAVRAAAAAGFLAWTVLLLMATLRGDAMATLAGSLGAAMGVPGWALFVATLLYPTVLAASAAWLAHLVSPRRPTFVNAAAPNQPT
jgi:uncharacterized membrane protein YjjB (DUF3815 family)